MSDSKNDGVQRNELGQVVSGALNPAGINNQLKGWTRYGTRIQKWLDLPMDELVKYADPETGKALISKLSVIDAICVRHVINSLDSKAVLAERKELLDRIEGTPKQSIEHTGENGTPFASRVTFVSAEEAARAYADLMRNK